MFSFNRVLLLQTVPSTCEKKIDLLMEREKDRFGAEDFKQGDYSPSLSLSLSSLVPPLSLLIASPAYKTVHIRYASRPVT